MKEINNIVFATDLAESSMAALETFRYLWPRVGGKLSLLHVVPPAGFSIPPVSENEERAILDEKRNQLEALASEFGEGVEVVLLRGDASRTIAEYVNGRGDVDLLVLGRHYYSRLQRLLTGVVADIVSKEVTCPVLRC